jgi:hypothetical protein
MDDFALLPYAEDFTMLPAPYAALNWITTSAV